MRVALWAVNLASNVPSIEAWLGMIETSVDEAVRVGAEILLMPEYACMAWLAHKPRGCVASDEVAWMGSQVHKAAPAIKAMAAARRVAILPGTWPEETSRGWVNRARLYLPDGRELVQDKLHPIPTERDHQGWMIEPGRNFDVINWRGVRIGIMICHDCQSVSLAKQAAFIGMDLVLCPSMTEHEGGSMGHRAIFAAAKSHADRYKRTVCAVGSVGTQKLADRDEPNVGGAAIYKWKSTIASLLPMANSASVAGPIIIGNI